MLGAAILVDGSSRKIGKELKTLEHIAFCFVVFHSWMAGRRRLGRDSRLQLRLNRRRCRHLQQCPFVSGTKVELSKNKKR